MLARRAGQEGALGGKLTSEAAHDSRTGVCSW
jgi:hypothetical protein